MSKSWTPEELAAASAAMKQLVKKHGRCQLRQRPFFIFIYPRRLCLSAFSNC